MNGKLRKGQVLCVCLNCRAEFIDTKSHVDWGGGKYCCRECMSAAYRSGQIVNPRRRTAEPVKCHRCHRMFKPPADRHPKYTWWCDVCRKMYIDEVSPGLNWLGRGA